MILYHFTSQFHIKKIRTEGLTKGRVLIGIDSKNRMRARERIQWLTQNPDWDQSWDAMVPRKLPYRRTEHRISIDIPLIHCMRVMNLDTFNTFVPSQFYMHEKAFPDSRFFRLFVGGIPPKWFASIDRNPTLIDIELDETQPI